LGQAVALLELLIPVQAVAVVDLAPLLLVVQAAQAWS